MLAHSPAATSRMSASISLAAEDDIASSFSDRKRKGESEHYGGDWRTQEPKLVQNTLWRVGRQNESENKATQLPIFHPAAVAASGEAFI